MQTPVIRCGVCQEMWYQTNMGCLSLPSLPPQSLNSKLGFEPGELFRGFRVTRRCRAARAGLLRGRRSLPELNLLYSGKPGEKKMALYTPGCATY